MKFVCIRKCFDEKLWEIGEKRTSDKDLTKPSKKKEAICWRKVGATTEDAEKAEKKTVRQLWDMDEGELTLYAKNRYKGTILDHNLSKTGMIEEIKLLEKAKEKEDKTGMV